MVIRCAAKGCSNQFEQKVAGPGRKRKYCSQRCGLRKFLSDPKTKKMRNELQKEMYWEDDEYRAKMKLSNRLSAKRAKLADPEGYRAKQRAYQAKFYGKQKRERERILNVLAGIQTYWTNKRGNIQE